MAEQSSMNLPKGITLRSDGRYMARFTYEGKSYVLYDTNLRKIKKALADKRYEVEHGLYVKEANITVGDWFDTWIREYKICTTKKGTIVAYCGAFNTIAVLLCTGLRSGEGRALEWSDISFEKKSIHVSGTLKCIQRKYFKDTPKTLSSEREIPMTEKVYNILRRVWKEQKEYRLLIGDKWKPREDLENLVFTSASGGPVDKAILRMEMNRVEEAIRQDGYEFEHITPHTLRHTVATRAIENGMPPKVLQSILGHSSLAMTMDLYAHVLPDKKKEEMDRIAGAF